MYMETYMYTYVYIMIYTCKYIYIQIYICMYYSQIISLQRYVWAYAGIQYEQPKPDTMTSPHSTIEILATNIW